MREGCRRAASASAALSRPAHASASALERKSTHGLPMLRTVVEMPARSNHASYWDLTAKLAGMGRAGISTTVLSIGDPWVDFLSNADAEAWAGRLNAALAEAARRHPSRIAALGVLPLQDPAAAATELAALSGLGFRGAIISTRPG